MWLVLAHQRPNPAGFALIHPRLEFSLSCSVMLVSTEFEGSPFAKRSDSCASIEVAARGTDQEPPLRFLIPNGRRILQQRFEACVLAQGIPVGRVSKFAGVNPARYFKQVRKSVNGCLDFAQLR